jgi:hypothetical protein
MLARETLEDGLPMHDGKGDVRKCPFYAAQQDKGRCGSQAALLGLAHQWPPLMPCLLLCCTQVPWRAAAAPSGQPWLY